MNYAANRHIPQSDRGEGQPDTARKWRVDPLRRNPPCTERLFALLPPFPSASLLAWTMRVRYRSSATLLLEPPLPQFDLQY